MKKVIKGLYLGMTTIILIFVVGCSGIRIIPQAPTTMPISNDPLPLKVGVIIEGQSITGGFSDFGPRFSEILKNSNIFEEVYYPVIYNTDSIEKLDLFIFGRFTGTFVADPALHGKAFVTGFFLFLPAPAVTYNHKYVATGDVTFKDKKGKVYKKYTDKQEVIAKIKISSPPTEVERKGVKSATDNLLSKLVGKILEDKPFYRETIK